MQTALFGHFVRFVGERVGSESSRSKDADRRFPLARNLPTASVCSLRLPSVHERNEHQLVAIESRPVCSVGSNKIDPFKFTRFERL
jgi:hypothetical protein